MLENEDITDYHKLHSVLKERIQEDKMNYIFLDEIQLVENFEKVVDSLFILPNVAIYLTGSNASMLSSEIATLLSGRYIEINILPLEAININSFEVKTTGLLFTKDTLKIAKQGLSL